MAIQVLIANGVNLPTVSTEDNGKVLAVVNGKWDKSEAMASVFAAGTTAPTNTKLLWIDTTATTGGLKYYNGTSWVAVPVQFT